MTIAARNIEGLNIAKQLPQPQFEKIPDELKELEQWCCFKLQSRENKMTKIPMNPHNGELGKSNDETTWSDFDTAVAAIENFKFDGLGFYFKEPYFGIDIDDVKEEIDRFQNDDHEDNIVSEFIDMMCSYSEISVSGTGIHIIAKGSLPPGARRRANIEMYDSCRFFVMTGNRMGTYTRVEEDEFNKINYLHNKYLQKSKVPESRNTINDSYGTSFTEEQLVNIALKSKVGARFQIFLNGGWEQFYDSQSEADMAFANDLAFWANRDYSKMDSIFRRSSLMRDKWDRKQNSSTYGDETLQKAIVDCTNTFDPQEIDVKKLNDSDDPKTWFSKNPNGTTSFLHHVLGKKVREEYHIVRYPNAHGDLYYYNKKRGIYEQDSSGRQIKGVIRNFDETLKNGQINEVFRFVEDTCSIVKEISTNYIAVGNGLINFKNKKLEEFSQKHFVIQKVPTNYVPNAYDEFVENTLKKVTQDYEPSIKNIREMFACVLYPGILVPKLWYLYGKTASNGKSSLINMIQNTFNSEGGNISAISPHKLATNNFSGAAIYGKLSNIVDDNPDFQIEDSGDLKTIITGGYTQIERKGRDSTTVRISTTMIVASNHLPNFSESGNAINRRLWILAFEHNFSKDKDCLSDLETQQKISSQSAKEYVLKLAVETVFEMLENPNPDKLTPNQKCQDILKTFAEQNDPWLDYFANYTISYFDEHTGETVIKDYQNWCKDNMVLPLSNKKFKELVSTHLDMEWKDKRVEINGVSKVKKGFKSKPQQESQQKATGFKF